MSDVNSKEDMFLDKLVLSPLTKLSHNDPDIHLIGDSIAIPSVVADISASTSSVGVSSIPAREDHIHYLPVSARYDPTLNADGTAALPSISFALDTNTGIYRPGADQLGFTTGGSKRAAFDASGHLVIDPTTGASISNIDGTQALPAYAFNNDLDTGMWRGGTDILNLSTAGTTRLNITAAGLFNINGSTYFVDNGLCEGRLTLTSGTPITTADVSAANVLYFTPYKGNRLALYNGTNWIEYTFTERSLSGFIGSASLPEDIFIYDNSGTLTLEVTAWSSDTARNTALVYQDGILVKSGTTSKRYLGTIYGGAAGLEDSITKRYVWNYYNRVRKTMKGTETTVSWTYSTAAFRAANNGTLARLNMVIGVMEEAVDVSMEQYVASSVAGLCSSGVALDGTTSAALLQKNMDINVLNHSGITSGRLVNYPGIGFHYYQLMEYGVGSGTQTWYGSASGAISFISGIVMC